MNLGLSKHVIEREQEVGSYLVLLVPQSLQ